ncbi:MAG TPA: ATP synthase F0 subunit B [Candidatus Elarobacter sp.]|jgi:F-type H+-transporting ATPase subunit b|nr:ATP synthase F0 subunit B [Candidatus Elarobacter sp.]
MDTNFFEQVALWSQVAGSVAFLVVLILMFRKYLIPAVVANQQARNAEIAEAEARRARTQAEAAKARADIESAERDALEIRSRVEALAKRTAAEILAEAKAEGERVVRNAEGELERARYAARDRLRIELIEKALAKAREEAPARVTDDLNEKLVRTTVDDVARGKG